MKKITLTSVMTALMALKANAIIVFDPSNYAENIKTAVSTLQLLQQTQDQLSYLKNQQYGMLLNQLNTLQNSYQLQQNNSQNLTSMNQLLANNEAVINSYHGTSEYALLEGLNPDDGNYQQQRDEILKDYYHQPEDPNQINTQFQGILDSTSLQAMTAEADHNKNNYNRLLDSLAISSKERKAETSRQQYIQQYNNQLQTLGSQSQLQTEQLTASELNLLLQQQESQADSLRTVQQAQVQSVAEETSAESEDFENEQSRLLNAAKQDGSGFGRNTWGNF